MPLAVPEIEQVSLPGPLRSNSLRSGLLAGLRQRIRALERPPVLDECRAAHEGPGGAETQSPPWTLGASEIDVHLGPAGLHPFGVHEIKPHHHGAGGASAGAWAAALGFACALAVRRLVQIDSSPGIGPPTVLWCATSAFFADQGHPYGAGLSDLGLPRSRLLLVEAPRSSDALWTIEEGLKSHSLALVVAVLEDVALTPARRLALAADTGRTPCLLLTHPRSPATAATATRWSLARHPSAPHPFNTEAPGAARYALVLERCRHRHTNPLVSPLVLEWSDAAHRFRMVSPLADRSRSESRTRFRAG